MAAALRLPGVGALVVTGTNEVRAAALARRYAGAPVQVIGFTREMHVLLAAADAFVTATSGLSCLEALLRRCPTISYGLPVAHVMDNARALAASGTFASAAIPASSPRSSPRRSPGAGRRRRTPPTSPRRAA